jgi:hypothetical protein
MLRNIKYFLQAGFCCLLLSCSKPEVTSSNYTKEKLDTDNAARIWNDSLKYNSENKILYSVKHDNDNLYISMRCINDNMNNRIMSYGMTLWIDTTGHRKEKLGIRYPLGFKDAGVDLQPPKENADANAGGEQQRHNMRKNRNEILKKWIEMDLIGFDKEPIRAFITTPVGIKVKADFDSVDAFCYRAIVPYKAIHYKPSAGGKDEKYFSIGFTTGKPENTSAGNGDQSMGGMRGDPRTNTGGMGGAVGPGGMGAGRMGTGGGGMHGGRGGRQGMTYQEPLDFWVRVVLNEK